MPAPKQAVVLKGEHVTELVAWSPDDKFLLSCGESNDVNLWNTQVPRVMGPLHV